MTMEIFNAGVSRRKMQRDVENLEEFYSMVVEDPGTVDEYWSDIVSGLVESRFYQTPEDSEKVEIPFARVQELLEDSGFVDPDSDLTVGRGDQIPVWGAGREILNSTAQDILEAFTSFECSIQQNSGRRETFSARNPLHRNALQPAVLNDDLERFRVAETPPDGTSLDEIEVDSDGAISFRESLGLDPSYSKKDLPGFYREITEQQGFRNRGDVTETSNDLLEFLFDAEIYPEALKAKVGEVDPGEGIPVDLGDGKTVATTYLSLDPEKGYSTEYDGVEVSMTLDQAESFAWLGGPGNYAVTLPAATLAGFCWMQPKGIDPEDSLYKPLVGLEERTGERPWPWAGLGYYGSGSQLPEEYTEAVSEGWPGKNGGWDPIEQGVGQKVSILCSVPYTEVSREGGGQESFNTAERAEKYFLEKIESGLEGSEVR